MDINNPSKWKNQFKVVREVGGIISIWLPPVNHPEGERVATLHSDYIPSLIAALKRFEQVEGRNT